MPFTTHGHKVPGLKEEGTYEGEKARCGGPGMCVKCSSEAGQVLRAFIRDSTAKHVEDPNAD